MPHNRIARKSGSHPKEKGHGHVEHDRHHEGRGKHKKHATKHGRKKTS